jgi:3-oxoadipate enol-lactonase/4-carboxymuconolactone decarboxylase
MRRRTGPFGTPTTWHERAERVRAEGMDWLVKATGARWFTPGFVERHARVAEALLESFARTPTEGYAGCCEALTDCDLEPLLGQVSVPTPVIAGTVDPVIGPEVARVLAEAIPDAELVVLDDAAHLVNVAPPDAYNTAVLGHEHGDRATEDTTDVTRDFQDFITTYAWGGIRTRPGLDRRSRSIGVITALVAGRHFDELEFHLRAALRNGLTRTEIIEVLLQTTVYVGVPAANSTFAVARKVLGHVSSTDSPE